MGNGHDLTHVEGRLYAAGIRLTRASDGQKEFSDLEVVRNLQQVVTAGGGVDIASGETPRNIRNSFLAVMRQYPGESGCYPHSPQIAQVVELLQAGDTLRLSIEAHTDTTGDAAHTRTLSQARAAAVVAAITDAGITGDRLASTGHGDTQPVADHGTDAGRAQNRRVELVRCD